MGMSPPRRSLMLLSWSDHPELAAEGLGEDGLRTTVESVRRNLNA
jgi:hypothetical protein